MGLEKHKSWAEPQCVRQWSLPALTTSWKGGGKSMVWLRFTESRVERTYARYGGGRSSVRLGKIG